MDIHIRTAIHHDDYSMQHGSDFHVNHQSRYRQRLKYQFHLGST